MYLRCNSALYVVCRFSRILSQQNRVLKYDMQGDIADDKYFRKANDSDATQWSIMYPKTRAHVWAIFWITFEVAVIIGFVLLGIAAFKRTPDEMYAEAAQFLPT